MEDEPNIDKAPVARPIHAAKGVTNVILFKAKSFNIVFVKANFAFNTLGRKITLHKNCSCWACVKVNEQLAEFSIEGYLFIY